MQAVSIAQKTSDCGGGYDASLKPKSSLKDAMAFVDKSIGEMISALKHSNKLDSTAIIVTAKHGQSPIKRAIVKLTDDAIISDAVGTNLAQLTTDTAALLWLTDGSKAKAGAAPLVQLSKQSQACLQLQVATVLAA